MRRPAKILPLRRQQSRAAPPVAFERSEFRALLSVYGRMVSSGEWRDYALDFEADFAQFAVYSRSSDCPVYRIEKRRQLAQHQGIYTLIGSDGRVLRRGTKIERILSWFEADTSSSASVLPFDKRGRRAKPGSQLMYLACDETGRSHAPASPRSTPAPPSS